MAVRLLLGMVFKDVCGWRADPLCRMLVGGWGGGVFWLHPSNLCNTAGDKCAFSLNMEHKLMSYPYPQVLLSEEAKEKQLKQVSTLQEVISQIIHRNISICPCSKVSGSTAWPGLVSLAFLLPSVTVISDLGIKAPFSLKGAVLPWFVNPLFSQTSEIYYPESLRAFFHHMSLTSVLHPWHFL